MRIAILGVNGFIGRSIYRKLFNQGHEIIPLVREKQGNFFQYNKIKPIKYNLGEPLPNSLIKLNPEIIINLAWEGIPDFSLQKCLKNLNNQIKFLKKIHKLVGLKKYISLGSCLEYGDISGICKEDERVVPNNYFSFTKNSLQKITALYCKMRSIDFIWFRVFYVYGPGQRKKSLIPSLIEGFKKNKKPDIDNPYKKLDFIYIDDVVIALIKSIDKKIDSGIYNIGSGKLISIKKIIGLVENYICKSNIYTNSISKKMNNNQIEKSFYADINKIKIKLKWKPSTSIMNGVKKSCAEY